MVENMFITDLDGTPRLRESRTPLPSAAAGPAPVHAVMLFMGEALNVGRVQRGPTLTGACAVWMCSTAPNPLNKMR